MEVQRLSVVSRDDVQSSLTLQEDSSGWAHLSRCGLEAGAAVLQASSAGFIFFWGGGGIGVNPE